MNNINKKTNEYFYSKLEKTKKNKRENKRQRDLIYLDMQNLERNANDIALAIEESQRHINLLQQANREHLEQNANNIALNMQQQLQEIIDRLEILLQVANNEYFTKQEYYLDLMEKNEQLNKDIKVISVINLLNNILYGLYTNYRLASIEQNDEKLLFMTKELLTILKPQIKNQINTQQNNNKINLLKKYCDFYKILQCFNIETINDLYTPGIFNRFKFNPKIGKMCFEYGVVSQDVDSFKSKQYYFKIDAEKIIKNEIETAYKQIIKIMVDHYKQNTRTINSIDKIIKNTYSCINFTYSNVYVPYQMIKYGDFISPCFTIAKDIFHIYTIYKNNKECFEKVKQKIKTIARAPINTVSHVGRVLLRRKNNQNQEIQQ